MSDIQIRVRLKTRIPVNDRPRWMCDGLAKTYRDFYAASHFASRITDWSSGTAKVEIHHVTGEATNG